MKTWSLLAFAALAGIPCVASADTLWVSSGGDRPQETIGYASTGTLFVPSTGGGSTGVVSSGTAYSTLTVAGFNGDGVPDLMSMLAAATQGSESPGTIIIGEDNAKGKVLWRVELDDAMVYQAHFPASAGRKEGGPSPDTVSITFASPVPEQGAYGDGLPTGRRDHGPSLSVALLLPAVQDPAGITNISDLTITFPSAITSPVAGTVPSAPEISNLLVTTPSNIDDGYAEWMSSVIKNGSDLQQGSIIYTFSDGSSFVIGLNLQVSSLVFSTTGNKTATLEANLDQEGGTFNPGD